MSGACGPGLWAARAASVLCCERLRLCSFSPLMTPWVSFCAGSLNVQESPQLPQLLFSRDVQSLGDVNTHIYGSKITN